MNDIAKVIEDYLLNPCLFVLIIEAIFRRDEVYISKTTLFVKLEKRLNI